MPTLQNPLNVRPEQLLGLVDNDPDPVSDETSEQVFQSVVEELCPDLVNSASLGACSRKLGYTGSLKHHHAIKSFLLSSLQAHRILAHKNKNNAMANNSSPQYRISANLTRLFHALDTPPVNPDSAPLPKLIDQITNHVRNLKLDVQTPSELQSPILSEDDCVQLLQPSRCRLASKILSQLQKEHVIRIGVLLTRLHVTTQSFSRAQRAQQNPHVFSKLERRSQDLQNSWNSPPPLTLFQTLTARKYLLVDHQIRALLPDKPSSLAVKDFLMGSVPDRGGRITSGPEMPQFQARVEGSTSTFHGKKHHHGKRASGKGRKRR